MFDKLDGVMRHLLRQFARRADHQCAWRWRLEIAHVGRILALGTLGCWLALRRSLRDGSLKCRALIGFGFRLSLEQRMQHRQQEGGRLTAAGLAGHHQVDETLPLGRAARVRQGLGDGLQLNSRRLGVAQIGHGADQFGSKTQEFEPVGAFLFGQGGACVEHI
jgi:hypothetical protein